MQEEKRYLGQAALNADDADFSLGENDVVNCEGFRTGSTDAGVINTLESVGGTLLIPNLALPTGVNIGLGGADDLSNRRRIYFNWNEVPDNCGIYCYDYIAKRVYTVLLSKDVVGGLNLSKYNFIDAARVANGCVYWTDSINEECRVDINAGINLYQPGTYPDVTAYSSPINFQVIRLIRRQPALPPTSIRITDSAFVNNFVQYEAMQFAWRFQYRNFEYSKLGPLSQTSNYNRESDTFNRIDVTLPISEKIDQDVIRIDLVALYLNSQAYFIIKTWDIKTDSAAFALHNNGTALSYIFYNDFTGIALDFNESTIPFDSVPIRCRTLEVARNRLFLGNYTSGYDTPPSVAAIALTPKMGSTASNTVTGLWIKFRFHSQCGAFGSDQTLYLLDISDIPDASKPGFYIYVPGFTPPAYPSAVDYGLCSFRGAGVFDVMNYYSPGCQNSILEFSNGIAPPATIQNAPSPPFVIGQQAMKSDASYKTTKTFYDFAGRKCGVVNLPGTLYIPDRNYQQVDFVTGINWVIDNTNALTEIPDWAYSYSVNLTKCLRTRFFIQLRGANATYATKDDKGEFLFATAIFTNKLLGCAFDISNLDTYQMGYIYNPGDIIKIYILGGTSTQLKITGQSGNWVTTELKNIGTLDSNTKFLFEIYTPYRATTTEPYFEQGQIFPIVNPGTALRVYSVTNGTFRGDITLLNRNDGTVDYLTEAMSPNDKQYKNWNTDSGRPNFVDTIGQVTQGSRIAYSATFIQGSHTNGLSTFDALNTKDLPSDLGNIMKLMLASKIQLEGTVMLAICDGGESASLYLSERTLASTVGDATIMGVDEVIGTINPLKGSRGTLNPESVSEYKGNVRWLDVQNGAWVQYSANGLFDISELKMTRFWGLFSAQYRTMTLQQIEALGNRPFVPSCVDTYHDELLISIPKILAVPPKGFLPDYPEMVYPFDIWDGKGKTIIYNVPETRNKWQGALPFVAESIFSIENTLYSIYQGNLYQHNNVAAPGNFYGTQYNPKVMAVSNALAAKPKAYNAVAVESNMPPVFTYLYTQYPFIQSSDLVPISWTNKEGVFYSRILRNKLDPKWAPDMEKALLRGEKLRATALYVMYEFDVSGGICNVKFINFGYTPSLGHTTI